MKLLLHSCCGPCSAYPVKVLREEGYELHGLFYNPNIHPYGEYTRRKEAYETFMTLREVPYTVLDEFMQEKWENYNDETVSRCEMCYRIRMEKAAGFAAENRFDAFTTTLLVSPYQKHDIIKKAAEEMGERYGVEFVYRDFRPGFREGQKEAREAGIYMQKYCGCIKSVDGA